MITLAKKVIVVISSDTTGWFGWISAAIKVGNAISKEGKIAGAMAKVLIISGGKSSKRLVSIRSKTEKAITAAKKFDTVNKAVKEGTKNTKREDAPQNVDIVDAGSYWLTIDHNAKNVNNFPSPADQPTNAVILVGDNITDARGKGNPWPTIHTWCHNYNRDSRLPYESCWPIWKAGLENKLTLVQTWGGTCVFYDDMNCKKESKLLSMTNRENGQLWVKHNDAVSGVGCTMDLDNKRAP
ncbi:hypothetical protein P280DRAFT_514584 [Massarina eburnea CBS 473.64]|uniref:Uncharacterized protein n=1 Tax=Massarina eburnea CBS 473.64 TaxID=1395130 RepID=A0A6A6SEJ9_9PLEO|nr:hypothetical protein P280DRAFT_514584 [Massarina eburnea CBS 473.64]